jgi:hypothetical protein
MGAGADENDEVDFAAGIELVDEQEIAADVAFAIACPFTLQWVVKPFRSEGASLAIKVSIAALSRARS